MAASQHIHFSATLVDSEGTKVSKTSQLFIDPAQTVTAIGTAIVAWANALAACTGAKIERLSVGLSFPLTGVTTAETAGSENEETVTIDFNQAGLTTHYGDTIPAILDTQLTGDAVNLGATALAAYTALLLTAPVLGGSYTGLGNEALTAVYRGFQGTRKHRRQLFSKSVTYA
jgi:hypothetical protein